MRSVIFSQCRDRRMGVVWLKGHLCGFSPVWTLMWAFRSPDRLNALWHTWHLYGFSPVWTLMWAFRCSDRLNAMTHTWHLCGFSAVWTLMWLFRFPDRLNALSHKWHLCGFSPLWILLCLTRSPDCVNRLPQTLHSNGFSPECLRLCTASLLLLRQHFPQSVHLYSPLWIFICWSREVWDGYRFSHSVHWNGLSPVCIRSWIFKLCLYAKRLWQTLHQYGLGLSSCRPSVVSVLLASALISHAWDLSLPSASVSTVLLFPVYSQHNKYTKVSRTINPQSPSNKLTTRRKSANKQKRKSQTYWQQKNIAKLYNFQRWVLKLKTGHKFNWNPTCRCLPFPSRLIAITLITGEPSQRHLKVLPSISSKIENSCMILNSGYSTAAVCFTADLKNHIAKWCRIKR